MERVYGNRCKSLIIVIIIIIKIIIEAGVDMITDLVNQITVEGVVPAKWKLGTIVNCFKRNGERDRGN